MRFLVLFLLLTTFAEDSIAAVGARHYCSVTAKAFAAFSKLAYCGPGPADNHFPTGNATALPGIVGSACGSFCEKAGFDVAKTLLVRHAYTDSSGSTEEDADFALVAGLRGEKKPADCLVAFRGTWTMGNWAADMDTKGVDFTMPSCPEGCAVVKGPYRMYRDMEPGLLKALGDLGCPKGSSVAFTGHSLGGQLANIAMFVFQDKLGYDVKLSYTFEQSRPFNEKAAEAFEALFDREVSFFRVTNTNDVVPLIPSGKVSPGFQVWYYGLNSEEKYEFCGGRKMCGTDGLAPSALCDLVAPRDGCGTRAPFSGPHCRHPLAPAQSFCNMAGNSKKGFPEAYQRTCVEGKPMSDEGMLPSAAPQVWPGDVSLPLKTEDHGASPCFLQDTAASPLGLLGHYASVVTDAQACQRRCNATAYCEFFTFRPATGSCEVTGGWGEYTHNVPGALAGPKDCGRTPVTLNDTGKAALFAQFIQNSAEAKYEEGAVAFVAPAVPPLAAAMGLFALLALGAVALSLRRSSRAATVGRNDMEAPLD